MSDLGHVRERLFADLCNRIFLNGFVYHSPKFDDPAEQEAGDVVIWVRRMIVNFELVSRSSESGKSTRQFVKRIGEKRKQLARDYRVFNDPSIELRLVDELENNVTFDKSDVLPLVFCGVIIVDCEEPIEKLHFNTVAKSLEAGFPIAVMTMRDFTDLLDEVDTLPDLVYYLHDRHKFAQEVYAENPLPFIDLNRQTEKNLVAFYKLHDTRFPVDKWDAALASEYRVAYCESRADEIAARNQEHELTQIVDQLIDFITRGASGDQLTRLHPWELAMLDRRQRVAGGLSEKITDAFQRLQNDNLERRFAFFNQATGCWLMFYFRRGVSKEIFRTEAESLGRQKLFVEVMDRDFEHSVFVFAFRKSRIETGATFDDVYLGIEDAHSYPNISESDLSQARKMFGHIQPTVIQEFPAFEG